MDAKQLAKLIYDNLGKQDSGNVYFGGPFVHAYDDDLTDVIVDGHVDLIKLSDFILKSIPSLAQQ